MVNKLLFPLFAAFGFIMFTSCDKIEPSGLLFAKSAVEDRYMQSIAYFDQLNKNNKGILIMLPKEQKDYKMLIAADSHTAADTMRLWHFFDRATRTPDEYAFYSILGDIAETKAEHYLSAENMIDNFRQKMGVDELGSPNFSFYPVVGNHDITHNGWAYFSRIMGSSTYFLIVVPYSEFDDFSLTWIDLHIFLDSANGTLGKGQLQDFLPMIFGDNDRAEYRNVFVYTHNPFFRPRKDAIASNFPQEELYYLLNYFAQNRVNYVFSGHIHQHGENTFLGTHYKVLDVFNERERPNGGEMCEVTVRGESNDSIDCRFFLSPP